MTQWGLNKIKAAKELGSWEESEVLPPGIFEIPEELRVRPDYHHIAFGIEDITVRDQAAIERIELPVLIVGLGVDLR